MHEIMDWARRHGVSLQAMRELQMLMTTGVGAGGTGSESRVASAIKLEGAKRGDIVLWRNNVGALQDERGRWVRYGLANDSKATNERIKSADLIGIYRRVITPADVGRVIGQFLSVETKAEGWRPSQSARDIAQFAWATGVLSWGGAAIIHASADTPAFSNLPQGATK